MTTESAAMRAISRAIDIVGSAAKLARRIDVTYQTVIYWKNGRVIPNPLNCMKIEKVTEGKVRKEDILPDYAWEQV